MPSLNERFSAFPFGSSVSSAISFAPRDQRGLPPTIPPRWRVSSHRRRVPAEVGFCGVDMDVSTQTRLPRSGGAFLCMARFNDPIEPKTLANMRENGVRSLDVSCWLCHHQAIISAAPWPDDMPVPTFGPRMVCTRCGIIGADGRPNRREQQNAKA
jgi:hypothetical protein